MKYMVMETGLSYAVVMDEDGKFLTVPNLNYEVGQTVTDVVIFDKDLGRARKKRLEHQLFAFAACLVLLVLSGFYVWNQPVNFVLVEINPMVKIESNFFDRVINVKGVNFDGEQLLAGYERKGSTAEEVTKEVAALAKQKGYLNEENNQIRISGDENEAEIIAVLKDYFGGEVDVISGKEDWAYEIIDEEPPENTQVNVDITLEEAIAIALDSVGIEGAVCTDSEFDAEDNEYEIELSANGTEYEYKISITGKILEWPDFDFHHDGDEHGYDDDDD